MRVKTLVCANCGDGAKRKHIGFELVKRADSLGMDEPAQEMFLCDEDCYLAFDFDPAEWEAA